MGFGGENPRRSVGTTLSAYADAVAAIVIAPACASCGSVLELPLAGPVCGGCWQAIPPAPLSWHTPSAGITVDSAGIYDGALRDIIHAWKFERRQSLARPLATLMTERCGHAVKACEVAVAVPMTPWRKWRRGFNQADDLARRAGLPVSRALARWRPRPAQSTLASSRRWSNLEASVFVPSWRQRAIRGRRVLLVDDVVTTGATIEACAAVLMAAGAGDVRAVTVARTLLRGRPGR